MTTVSEQADYYFIRHGAVGALDFSPDAPISVEGRIDALRAAEHLGSLGLTGDNLYLLTSTTQRTVQTGAVAGDFLGIPKERRFASDRLRVASGTDVMGLGDLDQFMDETLAGLEVPEDVASHAGIVVVHEPLMSYLQSRDGNVGIPHGTVIPYHRGSWQPSLYYRPSGSAERRLTESLKGLV